LFAPPGVLTVATCVVAKLLLTAPQAHPLLARTGLPTSTSVPVVLSGSNH